MHCQDDSLDVLELVLVERHRIELERFDLGQRSRQLVHTRPAPHLRVVLHDHPRNLALLELSAEVLVAGQLWDACDTMYRRCIVRYQSRIVVYRIMYRYFDSLHVSCVWISTHRNSIAYVSLLYLIVYRYMYLNHRRMCIRHVSCMYLSVYRSVMYRSSIVHVSYEYLASITSLRIVICIVMCIELCIRNDTRIDTAW